MILNLSGNYLTDTGVKSLCQGLALNKSLISLNLSNNDIGSEGMKLLAKALESSQVQQLNLSRNPIKNKGAEVIGEIINKGNNNNLEVLNLTECEITHKGGIAIYKGLKKAGCLRILILDHNNLNA